MTTQKPGELYWRALEPYWLPLNEAWSNDPAALLTELRSVPTKVRNLYAAHWCISEVENGGLYQFFYNSTGILAPESVEGLNAVGLEQCADAVSDAIKFFGARYPRSRIERLEHLPDSSGGKREDWDPFEQQDESFYRCLAEPHIWECAADLYASAE
jgi:hypothetical protein